MATFQSKQVAAGVQPITPDDASDTLAITGEYVIPTGGLASGSIIEFGAIPDNCIVTDLVVDTGILGTSVTLDAGILSGTYGDKGVRTMGAEFISAGVAATAVVLRKSVSTAAHAPSDSVRGWGLKIGGATAAATIKVRATLFAVSAPSAMVNA